MSSDLSYIWRVLKPGLNLQDHLTLRGSFWDLRRIPRRLETTILQEQIGKETTHNNNAQWLMEIRAKDNYEEATRKAGTTKYLQRVRQVRSSLLNRKNKIQTINTYALPVISTRHPKVLKITVLVCVLVGLAGLIVGVVIWYYNCKNDDNPSCKDPDRPFSNAAVAADSEKCSEIGRDILQKGGSAVDAAIAALLCTSIINPQSAGIGGGVIFTVMDSSGKVKIITSRETVPRNVNSDLLKSCPKTTEWTVEWKQERSWIGVPGEIRGYEAAHRLYGKLKWAELFKPTIKLAREGFPIPYYQGQHIPRINNTSIRELYLDKNGNLLKTGDTVKFEKLADTLETIANEGPDAFYNGTIAKNLISDIQKAGGNLTLQDLASYQANVTDAWNISLGDYRMYFPPPPSGGAILSLILNIMKGYKMNSEPNATDEKILFYHRYIEALKISNGLKKDISDPNFSSDEAPACYYISTTHVSVLAEDGSAVSVTSSINDEFGSKILSPSTGIILNNQLTDFCNRTSTSPSRRSAGYFLHLFFMKYKADGRQRVVWVTGLLTSTLWIERLMVAVEFWYGQIRPCTPDTDCFLVLSCNSRSLLYFSGERPPSNMAPSVLKSQSKTLVIGGSGSEMIPPAVASALMNHLWFGKSLKEAIVTPVVFVDCQSEVEIESKLEKDVVDGLEAKGHKIAKFYNTVNAVEKEDSCISAWSDERKKGKAAGY
ncbi:glutathione hydrolase 5 proenzyme-like [Oreochromis aureus]|uniref:glutathione hydrolase 5 proenzyme-like n=1 Tax=Oreochromis aureus TaxID=47969 RepID=UPI001953E2B7|nr:glutathione hydrolase 5 proenzyme-like [Oreochromis aureus]